MKILGICGSIREASSNGALLKAAMKQLNNHEWEIINLSKLPFFDPDLQFSNKVPDPVKNMRSLAGACDLIFISTPEYAHGVPGILKNGLEWLFCEATMKKKVAVVIGSAQGEWARDQLIEILKTMDFSMEVNHCMIIHGAKSKINQDGIFIEEKAKEEYIKFLQKISDQI
jgi:NAD(P)H-dependent FMN reductase